MTLENETRPSAFLDSLKTMPWFAEAGHPSERYHVVVDAVVAWDDWNAPMLAVWNPRSQRLEDAARRAIGDKAIDEIFESVSAPTEQAVVNVAFHGQWRFTSMSSMERLARAGPLVSRHTHFARIQNLRAVTNRDSRILPNRKPAEHRLHTSKHVVRVRTKKEGISRSLPDLASSRGSYRALQPRRFR